jgi:dihydrofolate reductase
MFDDLKPEAQRTSDVVASLAVTLDGFVCRTDGSVDYLDKYPLEGFDFAAWADRVGALVMGETSYVQALGWGWTWGDRPTLVLTSDSDLPVPDGADVSFVAAPTAETIAEFTSRTDKRVWVFGGGTVVTAALIGGVVDTLDITIIPEAIGDGVPLFTEPFSGPMRPLETIPFSNGAVRLVYDTNPNGLSA